MSKKDFVIAAAAVSVLTGLFYLSYLFAKNDTKIAIKDVNTAINIGRPIVSWQEITITEKEQNIFITMTVPRIIIYNNDNQKNNLNEAIMECIDLLKDDFVFSVSTAAYDNEEKNILNIDTEILLLTPRLISLAFTTTEHLAGTQDDAPERTFLVFDFIKDGLMMDDVGLFRGDSTRSEAIKRMKTFLLLNYKGDPNCDLLFAPKRNGFAASCVGVDWNRGGKHLAITENIPISIIREFLNPSVLSDITQ